MLHVGLLMIVASGCEGYTHDDYRVTQNMSTGLHNTHTLSTDSFKAVECQFLFTSDEDYGSLTSVFNR